VAVDVVMLGQIVRAVQGVRHHLSISQGRGEAGADAPGGEHGSTAAANAAEPTGDNDADATNQMSEGTHGRGAGGDRLRVHRLIATHLSPSEIAALCGLSPGDHGAVVEPGCGYIPDDPQAKGFSTLTCIGPTPQPGRSDRLRTQIGVPAQT
jgi:hypothetical protein